jgi:hypothetical protein
MISNVLLYKTCVWFLYSELVSLTPIFLPFKHIRDFKLSTHHVETLYFLIYDLFVIVQDL